MARDAEGGSGHWLQVLRQAAAKVDEKKTAAAEEEGTMTTEARRRYARYGEVDQFLR